MSRIVCPKLNGIAKASAQGHATMSTEVTIHTTCEASYHAQNSPAARASIKMRPVNIWPKRSIQRATLGRSIPCSEDHSEVK